MGTRIAAQNWSVPVVLISGILLTLSTCPCNYHFTPTSDFHFPIIFYLLTFDFTAHQRTRKSLQQRETKELTVPPATGRCWSMPFVGHKSFSLHSRDGLGPTRGPPLRHRRGGPPDKTVRLTGSAASAPAAAAAVMESPLLQVWWAGAKWWLCVRGSHAEYFTKITG